MHGVEKQRQLLLITCGNVLYKFTPYEIPPGGLHSLAVKGKKSLWSHLVVYSSHLQSRRKVAQTRYEQHWQGLHMLPHVRGITAYSICAKWDSPRTLKSRNVAVIHKVHFVFCI